MANISATSKKYIFLSCAKNDDVDVTALNDLRKNLIQQKLRIYQPPQNENINTAIANGIENAALVLIFPSLAFQESKECFKILNYADQRKTPILSINHILNYKPSGWLGVILAAHKSCECKIQSVMAVIKSMHLNMDKLLIQDGENNRFFDDRAKPFFHGSTKDGNMTAVYMQSGRTFPMDIEVSLQNYDLQKE